MAKDKKVKMNVVDRLVNFVNPKKGNERLAARYQQRMATKFLNSGYDLGGASGTKSWAKDFIAESFLILVVLLFLRSDIANIR